MQCRHAVRAQIVTEPCVAVQGCSQNAHGTTSTTNSSCATACWTRSLSWEARCECKTRSSWFLSSCKPANAQGSKLLSDDHSEGLQQKRPQTCEAGVSGNLHHRLGASARGLANSHRPGCQHPSSQFVSLVRLWKDVCLCYTCNVAALHLRKALEVARQGTVQEVATHSTHDMYKQSCTQHSLLWTKLACVLSAAWMSGRCTFQSAKLLSTSQLLHRMRLCQCACLIHHLRCWLQEQHLIQRVQTVHT